MEIMTGEVASPSQANRVRAIIYARTHRPPKANLEKPMNLRVMVFERRRSQRTWRKATELQKDPKQLSSLLMNNVKYYP